MKRCASSTKVDVSWGRSVIEFHVAHVSELRLAQAAERAVGRPNLTNLAVGLSGAIDLPATAPPALHFQQSVLRERILEHVFVGDALRRLWQRGVTDVEVLRSEFDAGGYDLVMSRRRVVRHIQFKSSLAGGRGASVKVGLKLGEKPSGCVVWFVVTPALEVERFLWLGGAPGEPLPDLSALRVARHSKADATGRKAERPGQRVVPRSRFETLHDLDALLERLFGPLD